MKINILYRFNLYPYLAVDEILTNNCGSHTDESNASNSEIYCDEYYWMEVKQEIGNI